MVYLDNAATSYPKPDCVYEQMNICMRTYCANPGRGSHAMSVQSAMAVNNCREQLSKLLNLDNDLNICFTKNATEALNIAIIGSLSAGDHVITTNMEHNSVLRPLHTLQKNGKINLSIVEGDSFGEIDPNSILKKINKKTKMVVCTLSSNVNGIIMPIYQIGEICRKKGILFLLDASQGLGSIPIDFSKMYVSMIAFPGHKGLLGPQGTGGLYVSPNIRLKPLMQGGTGSQSESLLQPNIMPDLFESGTLNTPGIVGLGAAVGYLNETGIDVVHSKKCDITQRLYDGISQIKGIKLYSPADMRKNSGIVAFNINNCDSSDISYLLDNRYKIACRSGLHCAPLAHAFFNTLKSGIVRFSTGLFNTYEEIDYTVESVAKIVNETKM